MTGEHDGLPLDRPPFELRAREGEPEVVTGPRVGITQAADLPWRYGLAGSPYLSRQLPASAPDDQLDRHVLDRGEPGLRELLQDAVGLPFRIGLHEPRQVVAGELLPCGLET